MPVNVESCKLSLKDDSKIGNFKDSVNDKPFQTSIFSRPGEFSNYPHDYDRGYYKEKKPTAVVPSFKSAFPHRYTYVRLLSVLDTLMSSENKRCMEKTNDTNKHMAVDDLFDILSRDSFLSKPEPLVHAQPNRKLRDILYKHPFLELQKQTQEIPRRVLENILTLSDELNITEMDSAALLSGLYEKDVCAEFLESKCKDGFSTRRPQRKLPNVPSKQNGYFISKIPSDEGDCISCPNDIITDNEKKNKEEQNELDIARELFFIDRGAILDSIVLLIKARVSVCTTSLHLSGNDVKKLSTVILEATDKILNENLIGNLICLIRKMSIINELLENKLYNSHVRNMDGSSHLNLRKYTIDPVCERNSCFNIPTFGQEFNQTSSLQQDAHAQKKLSPPSNVTQVSNVEQLMYNFTLNQRQIASECLFYLAYHTQFKANEICALIDLIQDLTNGFKYSTMTGNEIRPDNGIGKGLPILDIIRDVPDPYEFPVDFTVSQPLFSNNNEALIERDSVDWKKLLINSLWHPNGLRIASSMSNPTSSLISKINYAYGTHYSSYSHSKLLTEETRCGGGMPQLLQCVSVLILGVMCTFDISHTLYNRKIHGPNIFGIGNALIEDEVNGLMEINNHLMKNSYNNHSEWRRRDIYGLLVAVYGLLLQPIVSNLASSGNATDFSVRVRENSLQPFHNKYTSIPIDFRATFRKCLEISTVSRSLTFARVSLLPSVSFSLNLSPLLAYHCSVKTSFLTEMDSDHSFHLFVLSDFIALYIDAVFTFGEIPVSRTRWEAEKVREIELNKVQEEQKRQFSNWYDGCTATDNKKCNKFGEERDLSLEKSSDVDLRSIPDCLDEILALVFCTVSAFPDCATRFWSVSEITCEDRSTYDCNEIHEDARLMKNAFLHFSPQNVVKQLECIRVANPSILSSYVSYLSALALAHIPAKNMKQKSDNSNEENGADAVNKWLCCGENTHDLSSSGLQTYLSGSTWFKLDWINILKIIRCYSQELSYRQTHVVSSGNKVIGGTKSIIDYQNISPNMEKTTAYYYGIDDKELSNFSMEPYDMAVDKLSSTSSLVSPRGTKMPKDLNEGSTLNILALLGLLNNVIASSDVALYDVLSIRLAPTGLSHETFEDDALSILSYVIVANISCNIRGVAYTTMANLITIDNGKRAWDLLDKAKILPMNVDYSDPISYWKYSISSFSLGMSKYNVLSELDIESKQGSYPSTEGLCKLLVALVRNVGFPFDLHSEIRNCIGGTTYVLFIIDYVLRRAIVKDNVRDASSKEIEALYFATPADKARVIAHALELVNIILVTNVIPSTNESPTSFDNHVLESSLSPLSKRSQITSSVRISSPTNLIRDNVAKSTILNETQTTSKSLLSSIKSPGLFVLASILSPDQNSLFHILASVLISDNDVDGIQFYYGKVMHSIILALALYVDSNPTFHSTKVGWDYIFHKLNMKRENLKISSLPSTFVRSNLKPLHPSELEYIFDDVKGRNTVSVNAYDSIFWRERNITLVLRIFVNASKRENMFSFPNGSLLCYLSSSIGDRGRERYTSCLSNLLHGTLGSSVYRNLVPSIVRCVGYRCISLMGGFDISDPAVHLLTMFCSKVPHKIYVPTLCSYNIQAGQKRLAEAMSIRLSMFAYNNTGKSLYEEEDARHLILDLILRNLDYGVGEDNLSHIMLGLCGDNMKREKEFLEYPPHGIICIRRPTNNNVLDTIFTMISDPEFVVNSCTSGLASKCYELIYRLCEPIDDCRSQHKVSSMCLIRLCIINKLRRMNFWERHLLRFVEKKEVSLSPLEIMKTHCNLNGEIKNESSQFVTRNTDVLHCMSWLLKGLTLELNSLMGQNCPFSTACLHNVALSGVLVALEPDPARCSLLLSMLFNAPKSIIMRTISYISLMKPNIWTILSSHDRPPLNMISKFSKSLDKPHGICDGYEVIDLPKLKLDISKTNGITLDDVTRSAIWKWSIKWNAYVAFACATSHFASSWSFMVQGVLISCKSLLFFDDTHDNLPYKYGLIDPSIIVKILSELLLMLDITRIRSFDTDEIVNKSILDVSSSDCIHTTVALSLSVSCHCIIEIIIHFNCLMMKNNNLCGNILFVEENSLLRIVSMIIKAINCCNNPDDDERLAILSCALSAILTSKNTWGDTITTLSTTSAVKAAGFLLNLATSSKCNDKLRTVKNGYILAARSGLSTLINFFDGVTNKDNMNFLMHLLGEYNTMRHNNGSKLSKLIAFLADMDNDVSFILERIASTSQGSEILICSGITTAILSVANEFANEISVSIDSETYGSVDLMLPVFFAGHLSLMNALLRAQLLPSTRQRLINDAIKFLKIHAITGEHVLRHYPQNIDLVIDFISYMYFASIGFTDIEDRRSRRLLYVNKVLISRLERQSLSSALSVDLLDRLINRVVDLAFHIAEYPFPPRYLTPLPYKLVEIQRFRLSQSKRIKVTPNHGRCWWDLIQQDNDGPTAHDYLILPDPPIRLVDSCSGITFEKTDGNNKVKRWSDKMYNHATSAARCLDICLMFLLNNACNLGKCLKLDNIAIGKSLCRTADVTRAIEDKLRQFRYSKYSRVTKMLKSTYFFGNSDDPVAFENELRNIECKLLEKLGFILGCCVEKFLDLSLVHLHSLSCESSDILSQPLVNKDEYSLKEFSSVILAALDHTQIEFMGIGCIDVNVKVEADKSASFSKGLANILREGVYRVSSSSTLDF